jgi:hypothetical protein
MQIANFQLKGKIAKPTVNDRCHARLAATRSGAWEAPADLERFKLLLCSEAC